MLLGPDMLFRNAAKWNFHWLIRSWGARSKCTSPLSLKTFFSSACTRSIFYQRDKGGNLIFPENLNRHNFHQNLQFSSLCSAFYVQISHRRIAITRAVNVRLRKLGTVLGTMPNQTRKCSSILCTLGSNNGPGWLLHQTSRTCTKRLGRARSGRNKAPMKCQRDLQ
jgi:hypothetical protein